MNQVQYRNANFSAYYGIKKVTEALLTECVNKNKEPDAKSVDLLKIFREQYLVKAFDELSPIISEQEALTLLIHMEDLKLSASTLKITQLLFLEKLPITEILNDKEIQKSEITEELRIKEIFLNGLSKCGYLATPNT